MLAIANVGAIVGSPTNISRVLLVDDYEQQLSVWRRELEGLGKQVVEATRRAVALELARAHRPELAIVDLFLGVEDGLECARGLREIDPDMVIIVVSGDMSVAYAMAAVRAGANDVLVKPITATAILRRVEGDDVGEPVRTNLTLEEVEWEHISRALVESDSNITQAAERLGIYRQTLQRKLRKRGRDRDDA